MSMAKNRYGSNLLTKGEQTNDYVENIQGGLVPIYYIVA